MEVNRACFPGEGTVGAPIGGSFSAIGRCQETTSENSFRFGHGVEVRPEQAPIVGEHDKSMICDVRTIMVDM